MRSFFVTQGRVLAAAALIATHLLGIAQDTAPNTQEMVEALKPRTRSLRNLIISELPPTGAGPAASAPARQGDASGAATAGAATHGAAGGSAWADEPPRPSLSMAIRFDFDSARLRPEGAAVLDRLAVALQTSELRDSRFLIEGHTDAKGAADYNLRLSRLRAEEVRRYLMSHGLPEQRLSAVGKGAQEPADVADPLAAVNRRVRIVNLE